MSIHSASGARPGESLNFLRTALDLTKLSDEKRFRRIERFAGVAEKTEADFDAPEKLVFGSTCRYTLKSSRLVGPHTR